MGDTWTWFIPTAGFDEKGDGGRWLTIVDGGDFYPGGLGVDDGGE